MKSLNWRVCATAVALALGGVATAQEAGLEEVTVTGSRIRATGFSTPTPVTTVTSDELDLMAPGNDPLVGCRHQHPGKVRPGRSRGKQRAQTKARPQGARPRSS